MVKYIKAIDGPMNMSAGQDYRRPPQSDRFSRTIVGLAYCAKVIWSAVAIAARFFLLNATTKDLRATRRHNWRWVLFVFIDALVSDRTERTSERTGTLIVLVNRLGDAIISKPLIAALRQHFGINGEQFTVLGDRSWQALADNLYADIETHFIDERRFRLNLLYRLSVIRWMRRRRYRRAICFMHHRLEMRDDAIVVLTGAPERIVSQPPFLQYRWYPWIFEYYLSRMTSILAHDEPIVPEMFDKGRGLFRKVPHAIDRQKLFYRKLCGMKMCPYHHVRGFGTAIRVNRPYVVLSFGASNRERCWPLAAYVGVCAKLVAMNYHVVFVGGPKEERLRAQLVQLIETHRELKLEKQHISIFIDELPFSQIINLYSGASCFIGTDTGGSHLAMWVGTPTVTILHADPGMEAYHRLGDFFPYPQNILPTPYKAVWTSLEEFQRIDLGAAGDRVLAATNTLVNRRQSALTSITQSAFLAT